jgi:serine/threonine-protein kinase HipA
MSQHRCSVHLWGKKVGSVVQLENRKIFFQYDKDFRTQGLEPSPIHLPVAYEPYETTPLLQFSGLPGFLSDSLPDNYGARIMEKHFMDQFGTSPYHISPIQKLLYIGHRGQGALEFDPPEKLTIETQRSIEIAQLVDQARRVVSGDAIDVLSEVFQYSSDSLNGAKAKATLGWNPDTNTMISGATRMPDGFEPWIVKFDGTSREKSHEEHCINEYCKKRRHSDIQMIVVA